MGIDCRVVGTQLLKVVFFLVFLGVGVVYSYTSPHLGNQREEEPPSLYRSICLYKNKNKIYTYTV